METIKELIPESGVFIMLAINIEQAKSLSPILNKITEECINYIKDEFEKGIYYEGCYEIIKN